LLAEFVQQVGESASVAMLDQDFARYISHVPSEHQMRVFAEVGNQVSLHSSGVGKAILSQLEDSEVRTILERSGMRALTASTITSPDVLLAQLHEVRERGYAFDEGEHHVGVRCIAIPIRGPLHLAVSVSAPDSRLTDEVATAVVIPALRLLASQVQDAIDDALAESA
jgi:IclR family acetate operon transcriptional repressor